MIVNQKGFTGVMNPASVDDNLISRQLYPFPPIATTGGIVATPHQMRMGSLDNSGVVVVGQGVNTWAAILLIVAVLWVFGRE